MFAALTLEREPLALSWETFLASLNSWTQIVGGFAMVGLVLWLIAYVVASRGGGQQPGSALVRVLGGTGLGVLLVVLLGPIGALIAFRLYLRSRSVKEATSGLPALHVDAPGAPRSALTTVLFIGA